MNVQIGRKPAQGKESLINGMEKHLLKPPEIPATLEGTKRSLFRAQLLLRKPKSKQEKERETWQNIIANGLPEIATNDISHQNSPQNQRGNVWATVLE